MKIGKKNLILNEIGAQMEECIFCNIIDKKSKAYIVYEDENTIAFLDISPVFLGHTLIVPKKHYVTVMEAPKEVLESIADDVKFISEAVMKATGSEGIMVVNNNIVSQLVHHLHVHIIPRNFGDKFSYPRGPRRRYTEEHMNEIKEKIKSEIATIKNN